MIKGNDQHLSHKYRMMSKGFLIRRISKLLGDLDQHVQFYRDELDDREMTQGTHTLW